MIFSIGLECPYCGGAIHAYDSDTGAIVLNPDGAALRPCDHLIFGYYLSSPMGVDFSYLHPSFPESPDLLDFLAKEVHMGRLPASVVVPYAIKEKDVQFQ